MNTEQGIDFCVNLLKKFDEKTPKVRVIAATYSLGLLLEVSGNIYVILEKFEEALSFYNLAYDLSKDANPEVEKAMNINISKFKKVHKLS